jgi:aspartyl-tRNA(Asn)/glutamyl-tRNA(Gln) amidotransferase subunit A
MKDAAWLGVAEAGAAFRRGDLTPSDLIVRLLERISRLDRHCRAFIRVTADSARAEAVTASEEMARGFWRGPLHGIPYALKDIIDMAGLPTTCHSKIRADHVAPRDATVVARLRAAGAILIGKTALHEFASGGPADDLPWPQARNPWDLARHPGSSSTGSAAALAAGFVPAALGTDTGGSVRHPASACALVGMKPTYGAVSLDGVFPLAASLDHVGPMTRSVEDNALLLQVMVGHDVADPVSVVHPRADFLSGLKDGVAGLRIGLLEHFHREDVPADPRQVAALDAAVDVLRDLGARVDPVRLSPLPAWISCGRTILQAEQYRVHERWLKERPEDYCAASRSKLMPGAAISAQDYAAALETRSALRAEFEVLMAGLDAVIALSSFEVAPRLDDPEHIARAYQRHARMPFNLTGTPAIVVPSGFTEDGLPLSIQIAGRAFDEALLYRIAWSYSEHAGWVGRRPPAPF